MPTIQIEVIVDQALADACPALRPMLGQRATLSAKTPAPNPSAGKRSFDEFLKHRIPRPEGIPPVSVEDMERAIIKGACGEDD